MLNPFPELLVFSFLAPTLLRVVVGAFFVYVGYKQYQRRDEISRLAFPIVGKSPLVAWLGTIFHVVVGLMLILGYYTQIAALLAVVGLLKGLWLNRRYPTFVILSRSTIWLLIVISLSLLMTGAGLLAFDVRL